MVLLLLSPTPVGGCVVTFLPSRGTACASAPGGARAARLTAHRAVLCDAADSGIEASERRIESFPVVEADSPRPCRKSSEEVNMVTKAERKAAEQEEINERLADVEPLFRPSPFQYRLAKDWVDWDDGCDPDGFFIGNCPLQRDKRRRRHLARYNFQRGVMQCTEDCHAGMGNFISLVNASSMRANG